MIAADILRPFLHPEGDVAFRHCRIGAAMPMPETATHVDEGTRACHYDVGMAKETFVADAKAPAGRKEALAHEYFRFCVLASDAAHDPATLFGGNAIHFGREL